MIVMQVKALFERVGQFDHLIVSSGRGIDGPFLEASFEQLQEPWRIKYWSQVLAAKYGEWPESVLFYCGGQYETAESCRPAVACERCLVSC